MDKNEIWLRVIEAMTEADLSTKQVDIAKLCEVKPPSVHEWKIRGPGRSNLKKIAIATGVTVDWLETGRPPKYADSVAESEIDYLVGILRDLQDDELDKVVTFARYIRDGRLAGDDDSN